MARVLIKESNLQNIAAAIRAKNGSNTTYKPREMAAAIHALPSGSTLVSKTITQNGSYNPASDNADGYSDLTVNVSNNLVRKTITQNGSYNPASDNADGYSNVTVNVSNNLVRKTITQNGSYNPASDNADGYSIVTVNVSNNLVRKTITQNGSYNPASDNADGYSIVTVNVSGEGGTLVSKTITQNGSYDPADDSANGYSNVTVSVPNSYAAADEGKVVQNGALTAQTVLNITANGTYDTTAKNSVSVNVSGGSGGSASVLPRYARLTNGWVGGGGDFWFGDASGFSVDLYRVQTGHSYAFFNSASYGNRFRVLFTTVDVSQYTQATYGSDHVSCQALTLTDGQSGPMAIGYKASQDGYIVVMLSNQVNTIRSYCFDLSVFDG